MADSESQNEILQKNDVIWLNFCRIQLNIIIHRKRIRNSEKKKQLERKKSHKICILSCKHSCA